MNKLLPIVAFVLLLGPALADTQAADYLRQREVRGTPPVRTVQPKPKAVRPLQLEVAPARRAPASPAAATNRFARGYSGPFTEGSGHYSERYPKTGGAK